MGKSKKNKGGPGHRQDPILKPVKPPTDPELAALREAKILPVVKALQAADPKSRSEAASVIAGIIQDTKCRKLLLREQVVHTVLTQTLTDAALESRAAGWGILQVLVEHEEADFCVHLFRLDILTAIEFASKLVHEKITSESSPFAKLPKAERTFTSSIAASLTSILTALAEAGDDHLDAISTNLTITQLLFTLITHTKQEGDDSVAPLRDDAIRCLMILTEDNERLAKRLTSSTADSPSCYGTLCSLQAKVNDEGVLSCAVLHNIYASLLGLENAAGVTLADDADIIPNLTKAIASFEPGQSSMDDDGKGPSVSEDSLQLALEVLASIGTSLATELGGPSKPSHEEKKQPKAAAAEADGDEEMEEVEDGGEGEDGGDEGAEGDDGSEDDDDDEMNEDDIEADMDMVTSGDHFAENIDDLPTLKSLLQTALPELARLASAQPSDDASLRAQSLALSALNNAAWSVSLLDFAEETNAGVRDAWTPIARSLWSSVVAPILASDTADVDLATQLTGLAWALARALRGSTPLRPGEHRRFISLYHATRGAPAPHDPHDPFQALGVKCVGVLGQLALHPAAVDLNRDIGTFLLSLLSSLPDTPPADAVEAANQLFDIYGNEEHPYDAPVFWGGGGGGNNGGSSNNSDTSFLGPLEAAVPKLRALAKGVNKADQPELRLRADEVVMNMTRFLAYKKKHKPFELANRERG